MEEIINLGPPQKIEIENQQLYLRFEADIYTRIGRGDTVGDLVVLREDRQLALTVRQPLPVGGRVLVAPHRRPRGGEEGERGNYLSRCTGIENRIFDALLQAQGPG